MPETQAVSGCGEVTLDERAHVPDARRCAQIEVESAGPRGHRDPRTVRRFWSPLRRDRRRHEAIVHEQSATRADPVDPDEPADPERGVASWNRKLSGEFRGGDLIRWQLVDAALHLL